MNEPSLIVRVLLAIESYRSASQLDPERYDLRGPTARAVDRFLRAPEGTTARIVQSLKDTDCVRREPWARGGAQRLQLTEAGARWLQAGCPNRSKTESIRV